MSICGKSRINVSDTVSARNSATRNLSCRELQPRQRSEARHVNVRTELARRLAAVVHRPHGGHVFRQAAGASGDPVASARPPSLHASRHAFAASRRAEARRAQSRGPAGGRPRGQGAHHRARVRAHRCERPARPVRMPGATPPPHRAGDQARGGSRPEQGGAAYPARLGEGGQGSRRDRRQGRPHGRRGARVDQRIDGQGAGARPRGASRRDQGPPSAPQGHARFLAQRGPAARPGRRQGDQAPAAHPDRRPPYRRIRGDHQADRPRRAHAVVLLAGAVLRLAVRAGDRDRRRGHQLQPDRAADGRDGRRHQLHRQLAASPTSRRW